MNANQLLDAFGKIRDDYVLSAVNTRRPAENRRSSRRLMMAAAIVAAMLLLAGCAAVVVLHLQDMKAGERTDTRRFNEFGKYDPAEVTVELITPHGLKGSPGHLATVEWWEFKDNYNPEDPAANENVPQKYNLFYPESYMHVYNCSTPAMAAKLDEIAKKYGLQLLDEAVLIQRYQKDLVYDAMGINGVTRADAAAEVDECGGTFYPSGDFHNELLLKLAGESWPYRCSAGISYARKEFLHPWGNSVVAGEYDQWNYTTADGTSLLLVLGKDGEGKIFADVGDATIFVEVSLFSGVFYRDESTIPTREVLEQMADLFDYRIHPQPFDPGTLQPKLDAAEAEQQAQLAAPGSRFESFGEYLNTLHFLDNSYYCLMDIDADGEEELLLGRSSGVFHTILDRKDHAVDVNMTFGNYRICENGVLETFYDYDLSNREGSTWFQAVEIDGKYDYFSADRQQLNNVSFRDGAWYKDIPPMGRYPDYPPCTAEEAQAVRDRYAPLELEWKSILAYPMDESGTTLAQYVRLHDPYVTEADLPRLYRAYVEKHGAESGYGSNYFALRDVNGDGKQDLLLSAAPDAPVWFCTEDRGKVIGFSPAFYLCQGDVWEYTHTYSGEYGEYYEDLEFYRMDGIRKIPLDYLRHCLTSDTWGLELDGPEITESEALAILAKYPHVNLGMKPISELGK